MRVLVPLHVSAGHLTLEWEELTGKQVKVEVGDFFGLLPPGGPAQTLLYHSGEGSHGRVDLDLSPTTAQVKFISPDSTGREVRYRVSTSRLLKPWEQWQPVALALVTTGVVFLVAGLTYRP